MSEELSDKGLALAKLSKLKAALVNWDESKAPPWDDLEELSKRFVWSVFTLREKLDELHKWVTAGIKPALAPTARAGDMTGGGMRDEEVLGGLQHDSWTWDYADALTPYIRACLEDDSITKNYRQKHTTLSDEIRDTREIWKHLCSLVSASGVDVAAKNSRLKRLYLYLGEDWDTNESMQSIPIPKAPCAELADLLSAIQALSATYRVSNAAALFVLLQNRFCIVHTPYTVRKLNGAGPFRRIIIEVDPKLPADDVRRIYDYARRKLGWWQKPIGRKALELAHWAVTHKEQAWEDFLSDWDYSTAARERGWDYSLAAPVFTADTTDEQVRAEYDLYYQRRLQAEKNLTRDVNAAWRWVFETEPPKRRVRGERTRRLREMQDLIRAREEESREGKEK